MGLALKVSTQCFHVNTFSGPLRKDIGVKLFVIKLIEGVIQSKVL